MNKIVNRLKSIINYQFDSVVDQEDPDNILNVVINGNYYELEVDTTAFSDYSITRLFNAIKNAFSNDVVDLFFDFPVEVV